MADVRPRDVQVAQIGENTTVLRSRTWDRLKFEVEYARQRGTTANSYLIQASKSALIDPPGGSFTQIYVTELHQQVYFQKLNYLILGHINPNRMETLKVLLELAAQATIICSKPGAIALRTAFPDLEQRIDPVRGDEVLDLGLGHELQFCFVPTPRWPDALCTYDPKTRILYTDKLFGAHVCDEEVVDEHWRSLEDDRSYYFNCLHAVQAQQVEAAMERLTSFPARIYAPAHGPIVRHSFSRLTLEYQLWCQQQQTKELRVALLYTSAYGNTATVAQAIAQGITEAEVAVQSINCEFADPAEITSAIEQCDGFIIGSPTLGGHAPTQIQTALGIILSTAAKTKVAGVFGSYGWSGEAVDLLESKLQDAGYAFGFEPIRVKFAATEAVLQQCKAAGSEFAQVLKKSKKAYVPRQMAAEAQTDRTGQAVGRIPGSLCVVTTKLGDTQVGFLTSWVSQASFNPPGLTISVAKNHAGEMLINSGEQFVLNILKEGRNVRRYFLKQRVLEEFAFADLATAEASNGCLVLTESLAYLECTVENRMECGDHWLLYAIVNNGKVLEPTGVTAINHRKTGNQY
ncbi:MAG TPA: diflavin flavoprotein [Microcoleaceae cyanobacterium]|jgi:flavorubredoxin/flavin reductase (DIM6/NTAB) family NADH-FMN oxidoreductase RutF